MHAIPSLQSNQRPADLLPVLHSCVQGLNTDHWMFLSLFLSKLPAAVHLQCTAKDFYNKKDLDIMEVAAYADKCVDESTPPSLPTYTVIEIDTQSTSSSEKTCTCSSMSTKSTHYCWYHARWGKSATNCKPGCTFKKTRETPQRPPENNSVTWWPRQTLTSSHH